MPIFEAIVIVEPTQKEKEEGAQEQIIICAPSVYGAQLIAAPNAECAKQKALFRASKVIEDCVDRVKVLCRPFA